MISRDRTCIFVHIPKTGGSSLEDVIWPGPRGPDELWMGLIARDPARNAYQTGPLQHLLARQVREAVGTTTFEACFKFAIVRNPWDRIVSLFFYMRRRPDLRTFLGMAEDAPLATFLQLIQTRTFVHWVPQTAFVADTDGRDLMDFTGRYESFARDAQAILDRLGLGDRPLPWNNRSDRDRDYRTYYDADTRATVATLYREDVERFGYAF